MSGHSLAWRNKMGSYGYGKPEALAWVLENFRPDDTALDVGACNGVWYDLLGNYLKMDAVEIFWPNIIVHDLPAKYEQVIYGNILDYKYEWYDLIIFGDVIEHMTVEDAKKVLAYAWPRCKDMIVAVPYEYEQDEIYGNKWEKHIQPDLTPKVFAERYPDLELFYDTGHQYAYYHKRSAFLD